MRFQQNMRVGSEHCGTRPVPDAKRMKCAREAASPIIKLAVCVADVVVNDGDALAEHRGRAAQECGRRQRLE